MWVCVKPDTEEKARDKNENRRRMCVYVCVCSDATRRERGRVGGGGSDGDGERKIERERNRGELKLKQTDISDNNLMRFDLRPPRDNAFVVIIELFPQKFCAKIENPTIECRKDGGGGGDGVREGRLCVRGGCVEKK